MNLEVWPAKSEERSVGLGALVRVLIFIYTPVTVAGSGLVSSLPYRSRPVAYCGVLFIYVRLDPSFARERIVQTLSTRSEKSVHCSVQTNADRSD